MSHSPHSNMEAVSPFKRLFPVKENKSHGPDARSGHRIVVDDGDLYCYGGYNPAAPNSDFCQGRNMEEFPMFRELWKFNLASRQWRRLTTTGTAPKESASYACVLLNNNLLVIGGTGFPFAEVRNNSLYCCNLKTLEWSVLKCSGSFPKKVYGHSMIHLDGYLYLFGGTTGFFYYNDMYRLDLSSLEWELICRGTSNEAAPANRYRHEMATDGRYLYVFGGGTSMTAEPLHNVWAFDTLNHTWESMSTKPDDVAGFPQPRKCHGCVQMDKTVYITGGLGDQNRPAFKDVWKFDMENRSWTKLDIHLRKEVYFHASAISSNGTLFTFGGVLTRRQDTRRSRALYKADLGVKSLGEICWENLLLNPHFLKLPPETLYNLGVPAHYLTRIDYTHTITKDMIAQAS